MTIFLDRIDAVPQNSDNFSFQFNSWVSIFVDTLNENLSDIQNLFNLLQAQSYTAVEILAMNAAGTIVNGMLIYDSINNVFVGKQNGSLVKFTTTPYP